MTTQYTIRMKGTGRESELFSAGCFGTSSTHALRFFIKADSQTFISAESIANNGLLGPIFEGEGGFELVFPVGRDSALHSKISESKREYILKMFHEMWKPLLGKYCKYKYHPTSSRARKNMVSIVMDGELPGQLIVQAAACLRSWAWQEELGPVCKIIEELEKANGYKLPMMARYAMASGLSTASDSKDLYHFRIMPFNSHMQVPHSNFLSPEDVVFASTWTHDLYINGRTKGMAGGPDLHEEGSRSLASGFLQNGYFQYQGRDRKIVGNTGIPGYCGSAANSWLVKAAKGRRGKGCIEERVRDASHTSSLFIPSPTPRTSYYIKLDQFMQDVVPVVLADIITHKGVKS